MILALCNHKGGTGKTTTAIHFAAALGLSGYRVLAIDLDPQSFLTRSLGVAEPDEASSSLTLFQHDVVLGDVGVVQLKGFDLIPASGVLTKHMRRLNKPTDVLWVKEAIEHATAYDVILLDTAAAITVYSLNALVASHFVVIPVTPEYQPIMGAEQTFQTASMVRSRLNPDLALPHFLFTQVDARKRAHHMYRQYLRKRYKDHVMNSVIRTSAALANAYSDGTTVFDNNPYSRGARDYANATDEVIRILGLESLPEQETDAGKDDTSSEAPKEPAQP